MGKTLTANSVRMAMAALGWSNAELAKKADLGLTTVARYLLNQSQSEKTSDKMRRALTSCGIEFIDDGEYSLGGGDGVRFTPSNQASYISEYYVNRVIEHINENRIERGFAVTLFEIISADVSLEPTNIANEIFNTIHHKIRLYCDRLVESTSPPEPSEECKMECKALCRLLKKEANKI